MHSSASPNRLSVSDSSKAHLGNLVSINFVSASMMKGSNFRSFARDRIVWLMLMYPVDGRSLSLIPKAICGWSKLLYVHESLTVARIIVKVLVNNEQDIPDDFVVTVGEAPRVHPFTVPVYILAATDVVDGGDEQLPPKNSPAHPLPHPAPHWTPMQEQSISANSDAVVGDAPLADQMDVVGQEVAGHMDENNEPGSMNNRLLQIKVSSCRNLWLKQVSTRKFNQIQMHH
jgi:hypothetical protein